MRITINTADGEETLDIDEDGVMQEDVVKIISDEVPADWTSLVIVVTKKD